ncbi:hypothetical protein AAFF_G00008680 [Aldrovandia affinis]|uniref:Uncharacterized protein n=1 Tax=Aldrovandia affinis TaxID=143900 RepID=A0AAD7WZW7_9TELE|nr:hypothetical protein AAFF_G00008680 [Aldrovandia affinis]
MAVGLPSFTVSINIPRAVASPKASCEFCPQMGLLCKVRKNKALSLVRRARLSRVQLLPAVHQFARSEASWLPWQAGGLELVGLGPGLPRSQIKGTGHGCAAWVPSGRKGEKSRD